MTADKQEVFDELCERLMGARKHSYDKQRAMATELMQAGWDLGLNTDDLCSQYAQSLDDANEQAAEAVVGG